MIQTHLSTKFFARHALGLFAIKPVGDQIQRNSQNHDHNHREA